MLPYFDLWGIKIYTFPLIITLATFACVGVLLIREVYRLGDIKTNVKILFIVVLVALTGGKGLSAISLYLQGKGSFLFCVVNSGNVFYGCLIFGAVALFLCSRHYKMDCLSVLDMCASVLPLGQAIGRFGCFLNGCCYGRVYSGLGAIHYPVNGSTQSVFPTWFIEALFCAIIFLILQLLIGKVNKGVITSLYLMLYSVCRFFIEFFRGDEIRGTIMGIPTSQCLSVLVFTFAIILLIYFKIIAKRTNEE